MTTAQAKCSQLLHLKHDKTESIKESLQIGLNEIKQKVGSLDLTK